MRLNNIKRKHIVIGLLLTLVFFTLSFFVREYIANILVGNTMDEIVLPDKNSRVLVFAPHSDDEALGTAELIRKSIENGAEVKVVLVTNGDGFTRAVAIENINIRPTAEEYIKYGYVRQSESADALKALGVKPENIIFLGYPDRGISKMWGANWTSLKPYFSSFTRTSISPYKNSYRLKAIYSGQTMFADLVSIIEDFKPTHVIYPHPNDRHPDHWGVNAFVKYTLKCINYTPQHEWLYLVHRGDWPTPLKRNRSIFLTPPMSLYNTGTKWMSLSMSDFDIEDKAEIFKKYKSQIKRIGLLMSAFERKNELFGEYEDKVLAAGLNNDSGISANDNNVIVKDPGRDALNLEIDTASDILGLNAEASKEGNLHIFILLSKKPDRLTAYHLNMICFKAGEPIPLNLVIKGKSLSSLRLRNTSIRDAAGINLLIEKQALHIIIPKEKIGNCDSVFINAESYFESYYMDRTAWRMVDVKGNRSIK